MKHENMNIYCCPVCKSALELRPEKEEGDEIIQGILFCQKCSHGYKIEDSIPNLLPK